MAGTRNVMQTVIMTNIAPPPSGTTIVVQTARTMNVKSYQSGTTRVMQMPVMMNVAAPSGTTCLVIVAQSAGMFDVTQPDGTTIVPPSARTTDVVQTANSNPLPAGKSNARRKRRRANHKRNVKAHKSGTMIVAQSAGMFHIMQPDRTTMVAPSARTTDNAQTAPASMTNVAQPAGIFDVMQPDGRTMVAPSARTTDVAQTASLAKKSVFTLAQGAAADKDNTLSDDAVRQLGGLIARRRMQERTDDQRATSDELRVINDKKQMVIDEQRTFADDQQAITKV
jgi:hypothetical protein